MHQKVVLLKAEELHRLSPVEAAGRLHPVSVQQNKPAGMAAMLPAVLSRMVPPEEEEPQVPMGMVKMEVRLQAALPPVQLVEEVPTEEQRVRQTPA